MHERLTDASDATNYTRTETKDSAEYAMKIKEKEKNIIVQTKSSPQGSRFRPSILASLPTERYNHQTTCIGGLFE